jgi:transposase-like protein
LDEAEQEQQEQYRKKQRKLLEDQKFIKLKDAQDRKEEQQQAQFKETIERWQKRWPRQEKKPLRRRRSLRGPHKPNYDWLVVGTKTSTLSVQLSELFSVRCESWAV